MGNFIDLMRPIRLRLLRGLLAATGDPRYRVELEGGEAVGAPRDEALATLRSEAMPYSDEMASADRASYVNATPRLEEIERLLDGLSVPRRVGKRLREDHLTLRPEFCRGSLALLGQVELLDTLREHGNEPEDDEEE